MVFRLRKGSGFLSLCVCVWVWVATGEVRVHKGLKGPKVMYILVILVTLARRLDRFQPNSIRFYPARLGRCSPSESEFSLQLDGAILGKIYR